MGMRRRCGGGVLVGCGLRSGAAWAAEEGASRQRPVKEVADLRIPVGAGSALPLYVSADWSHPLPNIARAVLILHGVRRDAEHYFPSPFGPPSAARPGGNAPILLPPQFLHSAEVAGFVLSFRPPRWAV